MTHGLIHLTQIQISIFVLFRKLSYSAELFKFLCCNVKDKKTGKIRAILRTPKALELVAQRRAGNPAHTFLFEVESNRAKGKPISRVSVSTKFKEAGERLNLTIAAHTPRNYGLSGTTERSEPANSHETLWAFVTGCHACVLRHNG
ncbi:hypothetical protein ACFFW8_19950 [Erwinia tracheiphila]